MDLKIIEDAEKEYLEDIAKVDSSETLENLRLKYLGKKGLITDIMAKFREVPVELKKEFGQKVNGLKNKMVVLWNQIAFNNWPFNGIIQP